MSATSDTAAASLAGNSCRTDTPDLPRVAILGSGPAGTAAAFRLATDRRADVTVIEVRDQVGGNAGSFQIEGIWCDYGSHRLHAVVEERVMEDIRAGLGKDLLWRPRHGRIHLHHRWIHFPLKPLDLISKLPKGFALALAGDACRRLLPSKPAENNFASVLEHGLGRTMCESFYFPYARKLWGVEPHELSATCARRRVSGSSPGKIVKKMTRQLPVIGSKKAQGFYYPRQGFGQITESLHQIARRHGAEFRFNTAVTRIERDGNRVVRVRYATDGAERQDEFDQIWSTIPITLLIKLIDPPPPGEVIEAAANIRFRGMILIYLLLECERFSEYDAHYFPEQSVPISRMSEPRNYAGDSNLLGKTVLCAELPSDPDESLWDSSDNDLGEMLCGWLQSVGLPVHVPVLKTETRRLTHAYPVYNCDYERNLEVMHAWISKLTGLLTYGRQGLFAHDNSHHAMTMAYAACDCLNADGSFDQVRWKDYLDQFDSHVVED